MFDPFDFTDDTAGVKGCFKCGNPYGEPVHLSFSTQPIGCTACCKQEKKNDWKKKFQEIVDKELMPQVKAYRKQLKQEKRL